MNLSAVLLAGGESRRMGRDKATLTYRGQPLWRHQLEVLRKVQPIEIFISARSDPPWRPEGAIFIADEPPSRGPLSGLAVAIAAMRGTHLLVLAVDMPFMDAEHLKSMCDLVAQNGSGVLPKIGTRGEPLAAIYSRESLPHINKALEGHDFSMRHVADTLVRFHLFSVIEVPESQKTFFRSINVPSDLQAAESDPNLVRSAISY